MRRRERAEQPANTDLFPVEVSTGNTSVFARYARKGLYSTSVSPQDVRPLDVRPQNVRRLDITPLDVRSLYEDPWKIRSLLCSTAGHNTPGCKTPGCTNRVKF